MRIVSGVVVAALTVFVLAGSAGLAHHSVAAKFDEGKSQTLEGVVTLVDWRNPHVHVFINVRGPKGEWVNWAVELASPIELQDSGWGRESVVPGDAVRVNGYLACNGSRQLWSQTMTMP